MPPLPQPPQHHPGGQVERGVFRHHRKPGENPGQECPAWGDRLPPCQWGDHHQHGQQEHQHRAVGGHDEPGNGTGGQGDPEHHGQAASHHTGHITGNAPDEQGRDQLDQGGGGLDAKNRVAANPRAKPDHPGNHRRFAEIPGIGGLAPEPVLRLLDIKVERGLRQNDIPCQRDHQQDTPCHYPPGQNPGQNPLAVVIRFWC